MKHFLQKLLIFLIPVIVGLCFIEAFLRIIPNNYKYKKMQLLNEADSIQILILGNSHAHSGINPEYFSLNGFNFANSSQSLNLDYKLLEKYGQKLDKLKYVVIPVSYSTLFSSLQAGNESWRMKNYILYYGINPYNFSVSNYFEIINGTMFSNIERIYNYFKDKSKLITVSDKGFGLNYSSDIKNDMEKTGNSAALRHSHFDMDMFAYNKNMIENIIEWCKKHNVNLIFITLPAYYTYRNKLDSNQLNETINHMKFINRNYDNVYYYNLLDEESFFEEYFFDADHLNEIGAMKLTNLINDIIENTN
jgi:hypothetical protein